MAVLSLREAAEQAGTSKVDIWRAIRSGLLRALKTADGDFVVDFDRIVSRLRDAKAGTTPDGAGCSGLVGATA